MTDVIITYETLFDLLRKEKSQAELQELPEDFYSQVAAYLQQKERDVKEAGGPASPGAQKALIQERNVKKILRELHERRERKILEMALNRARSESNIIDTTPLLKEEEQFYANCAELLLTHKRRLLTPLLEGRLPSATVVAAPSEEKGKHTQAAENQQARGASKAAEEEREEGTKKVMEEGVEGEESKEEAEGEESKEEGAMTIRFIAAVPKFLGLQGEVHGPFEPGDTTTLPGEIATLLIKKRRAERA